MDKLILLCGKKQTGKSTSAKLINEIFGEQYRIVKFADKLKDMFCLLTGCTREQLENNTFKNSMLPDCWNLFKVDYCYYSDDEQCYKLFKTEKEATSFANDINGFTLVVPVRMTYREALQFIGTDLFRNQFNPDTWVNATMNEIGNYDGYVVIDDGRFPNECKAVDAKGGIVIRLERETGLEDTHESERALDDYEEFDYIIDNNGTIEDLKEALEFILEGE